LLCGHGKDDRGSVCGEMCKATPKNIYPQFSSIKTKYMINYLVLHISSFGREMHVDEEKPVLHF